MSTKNLKLEQLTEEQARGLAWLAEHGADFVFDKWTNPHEAAHYSPEDIAVMRAKRDAGLRALDRLKSAIRWEF